MPIQAQESYQDGRTVEQLDLKNVRTIIRNTRPCANLTVGARVVLSGLVQKSELNGRFGTIIGETDVGDGERRWIVRLDDEIHAAMQTDEKRLKAVNLQLAPPQIVRDVSATSKPLTADEIDAGTRGFLKRQMGVVGRASRCCRRKRAEVHGPLRVQRFGPRLASHRGTTTI